MKFDKLNTKFFLTKIVAEFDVSTMLLKDTSPEYFVVLVMLLTSVVNTQCHEVSATPDSRLSKGGKDILSSATTTQTQQNHFIDRKGMRLTFPEFEQLSQRLQESLLNDGYLHLGEHKSRQRRSLSVNTPTAVINYIEDSGAALVVSNPLQVGFSNFTIYIVVFVEKNWLLKTQKGCTK